MKKFIYAFASFLVLTSFVGCEKDEGNAEHNASFKVVLLESAGVSASVAVSSTGTEADTWYCFCSSDINASAADLVSAEVAKLGGNAASVLKSGNKTVSFDGLSPNTEYKAVVTGLLADGKVYGTPVELKFNSGKEFGAVRKNESWKVSYPGKGQLGKTNWTIVDFIRVEVGPESEGYDSFFTSYVPASVVPDFNDEDAVGEFLDKCIEETQAFLDQVGSSWELLLSDESIDDPYNIIPEGEYYAFAIGADTEGRRSGLWNCSEKFEIKPVTGSEDFMKYQGVWTYTDTQGASNDITFTPIVSEVDGIGAYLISGWQGYDDAGSPIYPDFTALYEVDKKTEPAKQYFLFMGYDMGMEVQLSDGSSGTIGTWGLVTVGQEGKCYQGGAVAELELDGKDKAVLKGMETPDGTIQQFVFGVNGQTGGVALFPGAPMLPCDLIRKSGAKAVAPASFAISSKARNSRYVYSNASMITDMTFMKL